MEIIIKILFFNNIDMTIRVVAHLYVDRKVKRFDKNIDSKNRVEQKNKSRLKNETSLE